MNGTHKSTATTSQMIHIKDKKKAQTFDVFLIYYQKKKKLCLKHHFTSCYDLTQQQQTTINGMKDSM